MKLHKILILTALALSLNSSNDVFAAPKKQTPNANAEQKTTAKEAVPFSHTIEKIAAISQLLGASADVWATDSQEISKSTKNLIICLAAVSRLASNITTQVINMNEDSSRISLAHTPWIIIDASQLMNSLFNTTSTNSSAHTEFETLLAAHPVDPQMSGQAQSSLQMISRQFTALGEGASVIAASFLRDRVAPITFFGNLLSPQAAREMCYTLSSVMRSGNMLLASKPSLPKAIFAVSLVAYSALLIYQFSRSKNTCVSIEEFEAACKKLGLDPKKELTPKEVNEFIEQYYDTTARNQLKKLGIKENLEQKNLIDFINKCAAERNFAQNPIKNAMDFEDFRDCCISEAKKESLGDAEELKKLFKQREKAAKLKAIISRIEKDNGNNFDPKDFLVDAVELVDLKENSNYDSFEIFIRGLKPAHFADKRMAEKAPFASVSEYFKAQVKTTKTDTISAVQAKIAN